ncbi:hypothetical protein [Aneurinibacillus tyrosinisolvens]|uniref:hypothetical protein n=1 Tax=Aneurinibacillus tyrosinisolvens TaxID=1443435 RepID=UPI00063F133D|nr:hypothetical protein [Aneurinibacillus tyrosinisolvens]
MNPLIEKCMLTSEQRNLILRGIQEGKNISKSLIASHPETTTKTYIPRMQYDFVNTYVEKIIQENPHTQMKIYKKKAGLHPYIVINDTSRNIFILVLKLPKNKYIFNPSRYRGDFASSNFDRLLAMGVTQEDLFGDIYYQYSLPVGVENQPFGIIVCYDGHSDIVFEGALRPEQDDWIYKEDITDFINLDSHNLVPINSYNLSDIEIPFKTSQEDDDIVIKLKNATSS